MAHFNHFAPIILKLRGPDWADAEESRKRKRLKTVIAHRGKHLCKGSYVLSTAPKACPHLLISLVRISLVTPYSCPWFTGEKLSHRKAKSLHTCTQLISNRTSPITLRRQWS